MLETGRRLAIVVTDEMIEAGAEAVSVFSPREDGLDVILPVAFRAMLASAPESLLQSLASERRRSLALPALR